MIPDPIPCAIFLFLSLLVSGIGQTIWMSSVYSKRFSRVIDGGRKFRNRPIFGANKTWRGFVFMVPATGLTFTAIHLLMHWFLGDDFAMWPLTTIQYFQNGKLKRGQRRINASNTRYGFEVLLLAPSGAAVGQWSVACVGGSG